MSKVVQIHRSRKSKPAPRGSTDVDMIRVVDELQKHVDIIVGLFSAFAEELKDSDLCGLTWVLSDTAIALEEMRKEIATKFGVAL